MYYNYIIKTPNDYYGRYIVPMSSMFTVYRIPSIVKSILVLKFKTSNNYPLNIINA